MKLLPTVQAKSPTSKNFIFSLTGTGPNIKNCAVVTWTNWDLQICLDNECKRKNLSMPSCFKSWIDLKHVYKKFYQRQPQGLNGALQVIYNLLPNPPIFLLDTNKLWQYRLSSFQGIF